MRPWPQNRRRYHEKFTRCFHLRHVSPTAMKTTAVSSVFVLLIGLAGAPAQETPPAARTTLRTQDSRFTLNGKQVFLYGISYYGALGAPEEFIRRDLDDME